jgi:aspartate oxidase
LPRRDPKLLQPHVPRRDLQPKPARRTTIALGEHGQIDHVRAAFDRRRQAADGLKFWERYVSQREFASIEGWELQNQLLVARLMAAAALERRESRGVHARSDFPKTSAEFASHCHIAVDSAD